MKADRAADDRLWKQWCNEALAKGAGRAHRIAKRLDGWIPTEAIGEDGLRSGKQRDLLMEEVRKWAAIWEVDQRDMERPRPCLPPECPSRAGKEEVHRPLSPSIVREVALTFPYGNEYSARRFSSETLRDDV